MDRFKLNYNFGLIVNSVRWIIKYKVFNQSLKHGSVWR
uniref:Uncharacterized protein n=1 Tax=Tetranychus urticae TaxID=32264 RepID=T1JUK6_TETUR